MPNIAMPAMSRLVAIGRRMKISERFMCLSMAEGRWLMAMVDDYGQSSIAISHEPSAMSLAAPAAATTATRPTAATGTAAIRSARRQIGGDARARLEPQLAFGDDRFSRFQPFLHHDVVGDALAWRDGALLDRRIRFDDEHVLAVLAGLHGLRRDHERMRQRCEAERDARELTRPQPPIGVVERRLQ